MKRILAIIFSAACIAVFSSPGNAEQYSISGSKNGNVSTDNGNTETVAAVPATSSGDGVDIFSGANYIPFIPIQLDKLVISLLDISDPEEPLEPRLQLNTGVKTENYVTEPRPLLDDTLIENDQSDSCEAQSSVVFIGFGLDFDSGYLKGNAFLGRPLETLSKRDANTRQDTVKGQRLDTDAYGFEASAGYQLNDSLSLGGGIGRITDRNKETDETEEVYAIYAQAILAVAPGIQVKPEVGQMERVKEKTEPEKTDESFYAGAVWEINF